VVVHACNASTWEVEARGFEFEVSLGYIRRPVSKSQINIIKVHVIIYIYYKHFIENRDAPWLPENVTSKTCSTYSS
jgi:hypothetical protein